MKDPYRAAVETIRSDRSSGATEILLRAAAVVLEAAEAADDAMEVAAACARAQPAMAGLLTLERLVGATPDPSPAIRRFQEQVRRAPSAIARHAAALLLLVPRPEPAGRRALRLVTCSRSRAVEATVVAAAREADVTISCAESRPAREGLELARDLADAGIAVELFSDAAISAAVPGSDALLVGADAVGPAFFVNKAGTGALSALAHVLGIPVYVLASREKVLNDEDAARLVLVDVPSDSFAVDLPSRILQKNPYFERVPLNLADVLVTDAGPKHDPGSI